MCPAPKYSREQEMALILEAAIKCIESASITDFTMSALSKAAGISMGSVYKHIKTKEDVMIALATEMYTELHDTFARIFTLPIAIPLKLIALHLTNEKSACCYKFGGQLEMSVTNEAFLRRASPDWLEKMMNANIAVENLVQQALLEAVANGELAAKKSSMNKLVEEILVAHWSIQVGYIQVARQRYSRHLVGKGVDFPFPLSVNDTIIQAQKRLLNTYPWAEPITDESIEAVCALLVEHHLR